MCLGVVSLRRREPAARPPHPTPRRARARETRRSIVRSRGAPERGTRERLILRVATLCSATVPRHPLPIISHLRVGERGVEEQPDAPPDRDAQRVRVEHGEDAREVVEHLQLYRGQEEDAARRNA